MNRIGDHHLGEDLAWKLMRARERREAREPAATPSPPSERSNTQAQAKVLEARRLLFSAIERDLFPSHKEWLEADKHYREALVLDPTAQAARAGVKAIIQPGGSLSDPEIIKACNKYKIAMVTTGRRHFKH